MKAKDTIEYWRVIGLPEYNGGTNVMLKSSNKLSTYTYETMEDIKAELGFEKKVIDNGEIEKYDKL